MSLGATELRGTIAVTPCAALRRVLYLISAGRWHMTPALSTRSVSPPFLDRVGFQYVNHYFTNIPKLLLVDPFWFSRVWFALVHSVFPSLFLYSVAGFKDNKGRFANVKITFGGVENVL